MEYPNYFVHIYTEIFLSTMIKAGNYKHWIKWINAHIWYVVALLRSSWPSPLHRMIYTRMNIDAWPIVAWWSHMVTHIWSILAQIMTFCLNAHSHYLNQCWLIISIVCGIPLRAISQEIPRPSFTKISLKITCLKLDSNLPGADVVITYSANAMLPAYNNAILSFVVPMVEPDTDISWHPVWPIEEKH